MIQIDNRALFIGVNDYGTFDESQGNPPGTSDLHGSRNDARAFWQVCRELGIPPENMRILTSPALDPADLGATADQVGAATEAAILDAVEWLGEALGGGGRPPGLLTYSGHGDFIDGEGLVLCPSDVTGSDLEHAIPYRKIEQIVARHRAAANLTVVLDCCHGGATVSVGPARQTGSLTGRPLPEGFARRPVRIGDRELAACEPSGTSWQARFSGVFRGAFSWALTAILEQWKPRIEGTSVELDLSYGNLLVRARRLLASLSFEQTPVLRGSSAVARTAFFHRGPPRDEETTSRAPSARRKGGQLDPDVNHTLSLLSGQWLISATGIGTASTSEVGYTYDTEYWGLDSSFTDAVSQIASSGTGSITFGVATSGQASTSGFAMPTDSLWTPLSAMPGGSMFWVSVPATRSAAGYVVGVVFDLSAPAAAGDAWGGSMTWYVGVQAGGTPPEYVIGTDTMTLSYGALASSYSDHGWSFMTLPPVTWSATSLRVPQDVNVTRGSSGDSLTTSLAAVGSSMFATVADNTAREIALYQGSVPGEALQQVPGSCGGFTYTALAAAYGVLYMACQGSSTIFLGSSITPGTYGWNTLADTGIPLPSDPGAFALAGTSSQLYLAYLAGGGVPTVVRWGGGSYTDWQSLGTVSGVTASGTPALAVLGDTLYLAFTTADTTPAVRVFRLAGTTWTETADLTPLLEACPSGVRAPALGVFGGFLFLACLDAGSSDVWLCSTADGSTWSGYEDLSTRCPEVQTDTNPALGAVGSTLYLGYVSSQNAGEVYTLCTNIPH